MQVGFVVTPQLKRIQQPEKILAR